MYCNIDMRYVDANETNNIKFINRDEYVHMVKYMLVKYIQYMHIRLTTMRFVFGNRVGRQNATKVRESSLWGGVADMMELELGWEHPGLMAQQERQRLLKERGRATQASC